MAKIDPNFPYDVYRFLIKPWRDSDTDGVLERYLGAIQSVFEATQGDITRLATLWNVDEAPDWALDYMLWIVGWTNDINDALALLTADDKRKLIKLSVQLWKLKGTELGIKQTLRLFTGRDAVIWNWFKLRMEADQAIVGYAGRGLVDPFLVGQDFGDRDEYLSIIWMSNETNPDINLIHRLVQLHRPMGEAFQVNYAGLVDDFQLGLSKWTDIGSTSAVWNDDADTLPDNEKFTMKLVPDSDVRANVELLPFWVDATFNLSFRFQSASGVLHIDIRDQGVAEPGNTGYRIMVDNSAPGYALQRIDAGAVTVLDTYPLAAPILDDVPMGVVIHTSRPDVATLRIRVIIDAIEVFNEVEAIAPIQVGNFVLRNDGPADILIDNVIAYERPMYYDIVSATQTIPLEP